MTAQPVVQVESSECPLSKARRFFFSARRVGLLVSFSPLWRRGADGATTPPGLHHARRTSFPTHLLCRCAALSETSASEKIISRLCGCTYVYACGSIRVFFLPILQLQLYLPQAASSINTRYLCCSPESSSLTINCSTSRYY
ncbi:conserved hypothetical protein [Trichinella spiralis]|uniref:hypothetical protein n=1 Tax=Trichinella spiralis TaxID=6334 RepID=UPI0001EFBFD9|nr:conserved hypothetical protein [Trichinella spiralis]